MNLCIKIRLLTSLIAHFDFKYYQTYLSNSFLAFPYQSLEIIQEQDLANRNNCLHSFLYPSIVTPLNKNTLSCLKVRFNTELDNLKIFFSTPIIN